MPPKKLRPPDTVFALLKNDGTLFAIHETKQDAVEDAVGPAFRPHFYVQKYVREGRAKREKY